MDDEMNIKTIALWGVVVVASLWGVSRFFMSSVEGFDGSQILAPQLEFSFNIAVANIDCGFSDIGFEYFLASEGVENYVKQVEAETETVNENEELELGNRKAKPFSHIVGEPTGEWQIVLQPNNDADEIRILGIGNDIETPLFEETVKCL